MKYIANKYADYQEDKRIQKCYSLIWDENMEAKKNLAKFNKSLSYFDNKQLPPVISEETAVLTLAALAIARDKPEIFDAIVAKHPENICASTFKGYDLLSPLMVAVRASKPDRVRMVLANTCFLQDANHKADIKNSLAWIAEHRGLIREEILIEKDLKDALGTDIIR